MEMGMQNFRKMEFTAPHPLQLGTWEYVCTYIYIQCDYLTVCIAMMN